MKLPPLHRRVYYKQSVKYFVVMGKSAARERNGNVLFLSQRTELEKNEPAEWRKLF